MDKKGRRPVYSSEDQWRVSLALHGAGKTEFEKYLKKFKFTDLQIPVIANVHAKPYEQDHIVRNLAEQITHSVRWSESMEYLLEQGEMEFEEPGVGDVLTKLTTPIHLASK